MAQNRGQERIGTGAVGHSSIAARTRSLPVGPRHVLYPLFALIALTAGLFGPLGPQAANEMPERDTHPWFPDHFWPYPILGMLAVVTLGVLAWVGRPVLEPTQSADPRALVPPHPDWYFLFLFQLLKLGPALITSIVIPAAAVVGLFAWPLLDSRIGPRLARRLGWRRWPVPGRNVFTGSLWVAGLIAIAVLTLWAMLPPGTCVPWPYNGPVCAG
ncbi:MAG TPA: hypothetical protein VEU27_09950 [Gemmatimonadales bacterium]|nr:hypothetical protein [Gemmatimonadales bacterium]